MQLEIFLLKSPEGCRPIPLFSHAGLEVGPRAKKKKGLGARLWWTADKISSSRIWGPEKEFRLTRTNQQRGKSIDRVQRSDY